MLVNAFQIKKVDMLEKNWWSKQSYLVTPRKDIIEAHTILEYCFTDSLLSSVYPTIDQWYLNLQSFMVVSFNFGPFLQTNISIHFSRISFNWYWHHTLDLKKKTFLILKNLFKTSGISTGVFICLKILLTCTGVDCFASCENIVPQFRPRNFPLPHFNWSLNPQITSLTVSAEDF